VTLLIIFAGLAIWIALDRQAARHRTELEIEYVRIQRPAPVKGPGLPILEAYLNIVVGAILVGYSIVAMWTMFLSVQPTRAGETDRLVLVVLATGVATMGAGVRAVKKRNAVNERKAYEGCQERP
jgi:hypothetical protein